MILYSRPSLPMHVMPSSLFQKAITMIFRSIIESASIYINDIFLDLKDDPSSHLLSKFKNLTKQFGIMLSQKRMVINVSEIDFLGMHIKDNQYFLETHVGQELLG